MGAQQLPDEDILAVLSRVANPRDKAKAERGVSQELEDEELQDRRQNRIQRKQYANLVFNMLCLYLMAVFFLLLLVGCQSNRFYLSNEVLLMLLGTTTTNVIGAFWFVLKYLFHK